MKLHLDFEPCKECKNIIRELSIYPLGASIEEAIKLLRHITYNHHETILEMVNEFKKQERQKFEFFNSRIFD